MADGGQIQAVLFDRDLWTQKKAVIYLTHYDLRPIKQVHVTADFYRYRILPPQSFTHFKTIRYLNGVRLLVGY
jgi:hypothetical protein